MSTENITKFGEAVATSPELQAKVQSIHAAAAREVAEKIAALSAETDVPFTADDFFASTQSAQEELSEEQLDAVAGGAWEPNAGNICASIFTLGLFCAVPAIISVASKAETGKDASACQPGNWTK